jgi:peptidyl-prolyl cis-trans isomerase A (cyclophilin A)
MIWKTCLLIACLLIISCTGEKMDKVTVKTTMGDFEIELDNKNAPNTVANFLRYVDKGYFDGTIFHRVIPGFMVQGGGFLPDGTQKETDEPIALENPHGNVRGTIAMARTSDPDSATSQFFINAVDNTAGLDEGARTEGYAVFGTVTRGMDVIDKIAAAETGMRGMHRDWPVQDVVILSIKRS